MYPAYGGRFSCTDTALSSALRLLARWMPVSSARPDSGDSSYATRILLNIFDSLLAPLERLQFRISQTARSKYSVHFDRGLLRPVAQRGYVHLADSLEVRRQPDIVNGSISF